MLTELELQLMLFSMDRQSNRGIESFSRQQCQVLHPHMSLERLRSHVSLSRSSLFPGNISTHCFLCDSKLKRLDLAASFVLFGETVCNRAKSIFATAMPYCPPHSGYRALYVQCTSFRKSNLLKIGPYKMLIAAATAATGSL